jgi:sugar/nucleoside kinase (ribokinase family)
MFDYDLEDIGTPGWIYLSSLGQNSLPFHTQISQYLNTHSDIKLAFQPGTFQIKMGSEALKDIYIETDIFCCNVEEAQQVVNEQSRDLKTLLTKISGLGPKTVLITDGMAGAYAYETSHPEDFWFMPVYPHVPYERTGAGDAFFSTVVSALAMGKSLAEALTWGPINSMSVVQQVGAQKGLLSLTELQAFLDKAPANYLLKKI